MSKVFITRMLTWSAVIAAVAALLGRHGFDRPPIAPDIAQAIEAVALLAWWLLRYRAPWLLVRKERLAAPLLIESGLSLIVPVAARFVNDARLSALEAFTLFAAGCLLLDAAAFVTRRVLSADAAPGRLASDGLLTWFVLVIIGAALLALPASTHPAVPDFAHNPGRHIAACAFMSASTVSLCGATIYSPGEDLRFFGQVVLYALMQAGGWLFIVFGLAVLRPWFSAPIRPGPVLLTWAALQAVAVIWSHADWKATTIGSTEPTWWPAIFHSAAAINNCALALRQDGLASYLRVGPVYWSMLTLALLGSIGMPIVFDRARAVLKKPAKESTKNGREFCSIELHATIWIFYLAAGLLWAFESPMVPRSLGSSRPEYLGLQQDTLADMTYADRWRGALLMSAAARSSGQHVVPLSEGTLKWPTWGLLLLLMTLGGATGSASGGVRTGSMLQLMDDRDRQRRKLLMWSLLSVPALALFAAAVLKLCQPEWSLWDLGLHAVSYSAGIGWTTGLTPHLSNRARWAMIAVIGAGRWIPVLAWCYLAATKPATLARSARKA